jgi:hypothetical protein
MYPASPLMEEDCRRTIPAKLAGMWKSSEVAAPVCLITDHAVWILFSRTEISQCVNPFRS